MSKLPTVQLFVCKNQMILQHEKLELADHGKSLTFSCENPGTVEELFSPVIQKNKDANYSILV